MTELSFLDELKLGKGKRCPCCDRYAQVYKRQLHATIIKQLIMLYNFGGDNEYVHISKLVKGSGASDLPLAKHWGLISTMPHDNSKKKTSGFWKLTTEGVMFLRNNWKIKQYAYIYNNEVLRFSDNEVGIGTLTHKYFDYQEIMQRNTDGATRDAIPPIV